MARRFANPYFQLFDSSRLDPHMEVLCRGVRKLSVTSTALKNAEKDSVEAFATTGSDGAGTKEAGSTYHSAVQSSGDVSAAQSAVAPTDNSAAEPGGPENDEATTNRIRVEWMAKSLTSIAPRYQAKSGECSVYSCLTQFTAPELLTGRQQLHFRALLPS